MILARSDFGPSEDIWQHLETFFIDMTVRLLLVDGGWVEAKDAAYHFTVHKTTQQRTVWPKMSTVPGLKNPALCIYENELKMEK